ncbi:MAG TPA: ABC transporter ATP-binding protein [Vicinamibacterales bacterium]|nr:ABC transporter ATP-binding protein [Vicinamibacterales bacterium]
MTAPAAITLDRVCKSFNGRPVLDDVSLDVAAGTAFCLLGRSGTGKSVTLRHIIGLVAPDSGRVIVHGQDVAALSRHGLADARKRMGFLFQNAALFDSMSVRENVAFPMRRHTDLREPEIFERVRQKLASVGLERDIDKMPSELSGGMRKRVGLARAMALDPSILLVDEPGAGLDPITTREIDELLLERKAAGATLVVVTHNIPSARLVADDIAMLHEGRIVARGTAGEMDGSDDPLVRAFMRSEGGG